MYAEQGYFTRGKKSKFTGEAGFDVVDVSDGINEESANFYIRSIGESIVFDGRTEINKWVYAVLPSRRDGRLSVTRAFPTSDGRRTCHFSHTYLFDEKTAKEILRDEMRLAKAARITGFCGEYIGEPVGLERTAPDFNEKFAPINIKFEDTGFYDSEQMTPLLNLIVLLHENRGSKPNPLKSIFIVYECEYAEFEKKAFNLISLLYSCLPYDIISQLGVVVKTDAEWRDDKTYISGYSSAYMTNPRDTKEYIPGGELYILNTPLSAVPADICVITVKSGGNVIIPVKLEIPQAYKPLLGDIVHYMQYGAQKPLNERSALHEFYKFTADIVGGDPSFRDMSNLYQLSEALRDPSKAAKVGLKYAVRIMKLLNISMEKNFKEVNLYWQDQANRFVELLSGELMQIDSKNNESLLEEACILMIKVGLRTDFGKTPAFRNNLYDILAKNNMLVFENEKLLNVLTGDYKDELDALMEIDKIEQKFIRFRDALAMSGKISDIETLLRHFDVYDNLLEKRQDAYSRFCQNISNFSIEEANSVQLIVNKYKNKNGVICKLLNDLIGLKKYDIEEAEKCYDYFIDNENWLNKKIDNEENYDSWAVKFFIFKICLPSFEGHYSKFKNVFKQVYSGFLERNNEKSLKSVIEFAEYAIAQRNNCAEKFDRENEDLFNFIKYAEFDKKPWSVRWNKLIEDLYKDKFNAEKLIGFTKSLKENFNYLLDEYLIDNNVYLDIYKNLCGQFFMIENLSSAEEFLNSCLWMFGLSGLKIYNSSPADLDKDRYFRFLMLCMWGKACQIFMRSAAEDENSDLKGNYCPDCYCIIPAKYDKCPICKRKITAEAENALAEFITVDFITLENIMSAYINKDSKKIKNRGENEGTFKFAAEESFDTDDTVEVFINGLSDRTVKFFSLEKEKNFMICRRRRTCLIIECTEGEEISDIFEPLKKNYFPYLVSIKKQGEGLPSLDRFYKNEEEKGTFQDEQKNRRVSMHAHVSYYEGSRPDELIKDLAQGLARIGVIKANYKKYSF